MKQTHHIENNYVTDSLTHGIIVKTFIGMMDYTQELSVSNPGVAINPVNFKKS